MNVSRMIRRLARVLIVACVLAVAAVAILLLITARQDKVHAAFLSTGRSVNSFLGDYKHALEDSFKSKDVSEVLAFYSDRYAAPGRGHLRLTPDKKEAAARLKIGLSSLYRKIEQLEIHV